MPSAPLPEWDIFIRIALGEDPPQWIGTVIAESSAEAVRRAVEEFHECSDHDVIVTRRIGR